MCWKKCKQQYKMKSVMKAMNQINSTMETATEMKSVTSEMKSEVKSHPKSVLQFGNMVKQPSFLHGLQEAVKNPTAEDSKKLLARITPHIHSCTPKVPFSPAQRKSSMKHIYIPCI